jgi:hypothetical protein
MAFIFKLGRKDGTPAGTFTTAVPGWKPGDLVMVSPAERYPVIDVELHATLNGVLKVEPLTG